MKNFGLTITAAAMLGGLAFGSASAAPIGPGGMQTGPSEITQIRMMRSDRMTMKKRMMREKMMKRRMMKRRMMNRM